MPSPSVPYTIIPATDYDPDSPVTSQLFTSIIDNIQHAYECVLDPATMTPAVAHNHNGINSSLLALGSTFNLIHTYAPTTTGNDNTDGFYRTGATLNGSGLNFAASGHYATHSLWPTGDTDAKEIVGGGIDAMIGIFVTCASISSGVFSFGLTDGHTSSFIAGTRAQVNSTDWTGATMIFWTSFSNKGGSTSTGPRWGMSCTTTPGANIIVKGLWVVPHCTTYRPWSPFYQNKRDHDGDECMRNGAAFFDATVNNNALFVAPV